MEAIGFQLVLEDKISGAAGRANNALSQTERALTKTGKAAGKTAAETGQAGSSFATLAGPLSMAAAAAAVATAAILGVVEAVKRTVVAADAARNELIHAEALYRLARNYDGAADAARAYDSVIGATVRSTGVSRERIGKLAEQLVAGRVGGQAFNDALRRAAQASSVLGDEQANAYVQSVIAARAFGLSVEAVDARMQKTLGGTAARAAMSLDATMNRLRESFRDLAKSLNIEPILAAFSRLMSLFDSTTWAGRGFQALFGAIFADITGAATGAVPTIEEFFQDVVIAGLEMYIALHPTIKFFKDLFREVGKSVDTSALAKAAIAALTLSFLSLGTALTSVAGTLSLVSNLLGGLIALYEKAKSLGLSIAHGISEGIRGGAPAVLSAADGMAHGAIDKAQSTLEVHSPSRVFAQIGAFSAQGFAMGMLREAPSVASATSQAIAPPSPAMTAAKAASAAPSAPVRPTQTFGGSVTVNITGVPGAVELEGRMPEILATAFEAIGLTLGVGPASSPLAAGV